MARELKVDASSPPAAAPYSRFFRINRAGENCRFIFCGDFRQDDLSSERYKERTGVIDFMKIIKQMDMFELVDFKSEDIVRSELVKQYIIAREKLGIDI